MSYRRNGDGAIFKLIGIPRKEAPSNSKMIKRLQDCYMTYIIKRRLNIEGNSCRYLTMMHGRFHVCDKVQYDIQQIIALSERSHCPRQEGVLFDIFMGCKSGLPDNFPQQEDSGIRREDAIPRNYLSGLRMGIMPERLLISGTSADS